MSDALTFQEKAMAFVQSTIGMVVVGGISVVLIVGVLMAMGLFNTGGVSSGSPFAAGDSDANSVVADSATNAFEQAWREKMETDSMAREKQLADMQDKLAKSQLDQANQLKKTLDQMKKEREALLKEMKRLAAMKPKDRVIIQAPKEAKRDDNIDGMLADDANANVAVEPGPWKTVSVGGSKKDIRIKTPTIPKKKPVKEVKVPMGSFARVRLMTGVSAPTSGVPWPTLMMIKGPIQGPNGQTYAANGCFVLGDAIGHIGTTQDKILPNGQEAEVGRVEIKMTGISCDWGTVGFDQDIVGYVVDKDKQFGVEGVVHNRLPKEILMLMAASGLGGVGTGISAATSVTNTVTNAATTQTITQKTNGILLPAAGAALKEGSDQLTKFLTDKAKESVTTIEIPGGVDVDFFVVKSFSMIDQGSIIGGGIYGANGLY